MAHDHNERGDYKLESIDEACDEGSLDEAARAADTVRIGHDGTLHTRELTLSPSRLSTPALRAYFARMVGTWSEQPYVAVPPRGANKDVWAQFDAWWENRYLTQPLTQLLEVHRVDILDTRIAGIHVGVVSPRRGIAPENRNRVLVNLRGGGFVYNRGLSCGQLESIPVADIGRFKVITVDYRQAPFDHYPAASEDVESVYTALLNSHSPEAIGIFGCSAGGFLAAQAVARFQARGLPRPGAIGIFSTGLSPTWSSRCDHAGDSTIWSSPVCPVPRNHFSMADLAAWEPLRWYMDAADKSDPIAYPASSDHILSRFPPTLFVNATRDFTMSAAVVSHARLLRLNVDSSLYIMEGGTHGAHVMAIGTPEAYDTHAYVARWFASRLAA